MDILAFLRQDHRRLNRDVERMAKYLSSDALLDRINRFAIHYELHENIERRILFPMAYQAVSGTPEEALFTSYQGIHREVWPLLSDLKELNPVAHPLSVRLAYTNFRVFLGSHFDYEEQSLFPIIARSVGAEVRERLGRAAELQRSREDGFAEVREVVR
jgi:hemerythrin-like domain-containing protein